ncbi:methyltransferase [Streptomyces alboniger]|uniref:O-demethylpuromycin-O-methyltransferase n=2 Tax=Streptomyces alboniger TaxID=132473 RepID=DMPM_STRAD|nr:methyltransferase [Streptomyces alboniger]P42712.1 RecName: Full=O-demethylpuromycin-O-methyltransferase [Streptomyces alboniger]pir/JQ1393/ O-demethylpuromycin O-methyltransferase (EC 2.1.1.38) - Streptomyces anulatus [Streptomyces anulatus]QEV21105.1 methyltransferase [Streptomyces alboniger]
MAPTEATRGGPADPAPAPEAHRGGHTEHADPAEHAAQFGAQERILTLVWGYISSEILDLATRLDLPDLMGTEERAAAELAASLDTDPVATLRLLRAFAALGLAEETGAGRFRLTPAGHRLRTDVPDSLHAFVRQGMGVFRQAWSHFDHSIRTGEPAFDQVFGTDFFSYLSERPELSGTFTSSMREATRTMSTALAKEEEYDFSSYGTVVDIGGADGSLLAAVLSAHPGVEGVVFDSPEGARDAAATLDAAGVGERGRVETGDFFTRVPGGGDLYVLKSILHDWSDARSADILRTVRAAMPAHARLLVVEVLLPDTVDSSAHPLGYLSDLYMLVNMGGRERSERDLRSLLSDTGFRTTRVRTPPGLTPFSLIEAAPV